MTGRRVELKSAKGEHRPDEGITAHRWPQRSAGPIPFVLLGVLEVPRHGLRRGIGLNAQGRPSPRGPSLENEAGRERDRLIDKPLSILGSQFFCCRSIRRLMAESSTRKPFSRAIPKATRREILVMAGNAGFSTLEKNVRAIQHEWQALTHGFLKELLGSSPNEG